MNFWQGPIDMNTTLIIFCSLPLFAASAVLVNRR